MEKYSGVKHVEAKPMTLGDYNKLQGWTIPANEDPETEGYLVMENGKPNHPDFERRITWSPKDEFEGTFSPDVETAPVTKPFNPVVNCSFKWQYGVLKIVNVQSPERDITIELKEIGVFEEVIGGFLLGIIEGYNAGKEDGVSDARLLDEKK